VSIELLPVRPEDKRIVGGKTDINQLAPFRYPWAWDMFLKANNNHWTPTEINMAKDVSDHRYELTPEERHMYEHVLAYLTTSDIMVMRNLAIAIMEQITAPEVQIYYARQIYEESLHTWSYQHCIETLGLDQGHIYNLYRTIPEINRKIQMSQARTDALAGGSTDLRLLVLALIFYHTLFEGGWFYNGFTPVFALQRRGLMTGTGEQFQYILRDESMHAAFGIKVINAIWHENKGIVDVQEIYDMVHEVVEAEEAYAKVVIPTILGYSANTHVEQLKFILNRRMRQLGLDEQFPGAQCTVPWLDEQINIKKEKNFFETRVTEYQVGTQLDWVDDEEGSESWEITK
jgi:ribonucleoside-diphosphate reductase beta chain